MRRAGVPAAGTVIVDLQTADGCTEKVALEQSVALLRAAVARVVGADVEAPVKERTSLSVGGVSRRSLLRGVNMARRFVAVWRSDRCTGGVACTACVLACPHGALRRGARRVVVDGDRCSGCGVCVAACRSGAFALPGAEVEGLSAAAAVLVATIRRRGTATGVAIACQHSKSVPRVGEAWLVLRVPSIEMVTAGWLLQLVGAGVGVRVVGCEDKGCEARVVDLEHFVHDLGGVLGFSAGGEALANPESVPAVLAPQGDWIELWEPEATTQSLAAFGALGPGRTPWRVEGPGCCIACGACVTCCPEAVVTLERAVDGNLLATGRQVVATVATATCVTCGGPVLAGLSPALLRSRIGQSHSAIADGMGEVCADCRLAGR